MDVEDTETVTETVGDPEEVNEPLDDAEVDTVFDENAVTDGEDDTESVPEADVETLELPHAVTDVEGLCDAEWLVVTVTL